MFSLHTVYLYTAMGLIVHQERVVAFCFCSSFFFFVASEEGV